MVPDGRLELLQEIWIMAIVVAALDAWACSWATEDATYLVLAEVFQKTAVRQLDNGSYVDDGKRAKPLRADIGFWRVKAQDRGLHNVINSDIQLWKPSTGLKRSWDTTRHYSNEMAELIKLLIWLLDPSQDFVAGGTLRYIMLLSMTLQNF